MPWLADRDVGAAHGLAQAGVEARTETELRHRALQALAELVPADVLTWDRVELATGAVRHEAVPADAEPPAEVLRAAAAMEDEGEIAWELFLSLHAVRERLARLEAKLGVRTAAEAVARVLRESA